MSTLKKLMVENAERKEVNGIYVECGKKKGHTVYRQEKGDKEIWFMHGQYRIGVHLRHYYYYEADGKLSLEEIITNEGYTGTIDVIFRVFITTCFSDSLDDSVGASLGPPSIPLGSK